jgi:hypothetical protein
MSIWDNRPELDGIIAAALARGLTYAEISTNITDQGYVGVTREMVRGRSRRLSFAQPTPEPLAEEERIEQRREKSHVLALRQELEATSKALQELREIASFYDSARHTPIEVPEWRVKSQSNGHVGTVMAQMTDWHLGEVVNPDEVLYLNAYNEQIAYMRAARWFDKVVTLPRDYVNGVSIEGLIIPATGDLFTGEIHEELKESNYERVLETVLNAQEPILAGMQLLEREYDGVEVDAVVGNHGRQAKKSVFKGRVYDNFEWLFWSIIRDRLADRGSDVVVNVSTSMDMNISVYERNYLLTHGDQFKGGTGISGAFAPLSLGSHRKGKRQSAAGMPMETMIIGHLHQLINIPGVIMGGTMKGMDEFAFGINVPPADAAQALWITTPERAQTIWMPVYLQSRKNEGW